MNKTEKSTGLCRVCSGRGEFDLFLPIPIFLHENLLEHTHWKKNISELISEITGLSINKDDGLPQKICEICISYLKHAYSFREQTLNNTNSLMKALDLQRKCTSPSLQQKHVGTNLVQQFNKTSNNATSTVLNNLLVKATKISDKINENNNSESNLQNNDKFFKNNFNLYNNLKSTASVKINFEEYLSNKGTAVAPIFTPPWDLIETNSNEEDGDTGDTPELAYKERKCKYCKRRYMFKDTYDQHINECVERKLIIFIWELNYIHTNKENNQITSKQFIQKTLMILKENVILLVKYSNDFDFPDIIPKNVDATNEINRRLDNIIKFIESNDKMCSDETTSGSSSTSSPSTYKIRCSNCDVTFESLSCLEIHNYKHHNDNTEVPTVAAALTNLSKSNNDFNHGDTTIINFNSITNEKLIEMIESEDNLIDVSSIFSGYFTNNNSNSSSNNKQKTENLTDKYKTIPCIKCGKRFLTVGHLDQHLLNKHHNQNNSYTNLKLVPLPPPPTSSSKYFNNKRPANF